MPREFPRRELTRIAAPLAFLAAVTIAVLLVHSALSGGGGSSTTTTRKTTTKRTTTRQVTTTKKPPKKPHKPASPKRYYVVVSGDTFGSIASAHGTTIEKLVVLNPGVDSNALSIGQKIRIG